MLGSRGCVNSYVSLVRLNLSLKQEPRKPYYPRGGLSLGSVGTYGDNPRRLTPIPVRLDLDYTNVYARPYLLYYY
jgi:hypothetical protein